MVNFENDRHTKAEISLDNLTYNYRQVKNKLSINTKFMGVIKADAYGHGAIEVGRHLEAQGVDYLAVAVLDEAIELREAGIRSPLLVFGAIERDRIPIAIQLNIAITVFSEEVADAVNHYAQKMKKTVDIHLKVDSGMGRIGARSKEDALKIANKLTSSFVHFDGIFTHFAESENVENPEYTLKQFEFFLSVIAHLKDHDVNFNLSHCANTGATLLYPEFHMDMIRTGISLYGYHPDEALKDRLDLKPVMKLTTHAIAVKEMNQGETIGYGRAYTAEQGEVIATVPIGYADGIPRELSNRWVLTTPNGGKAQIVGRICMDQLMLNVSNTTDFSVEEELVILGDPSQGYPSIYEMAALSDRFHYEILCGIGKRVPRVYI